MSCRVELLVVVVDDGDNPAPMVTMLLFLRPRCAGILLAVSDGLSSMAEETARRDKEDVITVGRPESLPGSGEEHTAPSAFPEHKIMT